MNQEEKIEDSFPNKKIRTTIEDNDQKCCFSAVEIGRIFLEIEQCQSEQFKNGQSYEIMDKMKLHKLLYYAQGYYLSFYEKPLFQEEIFAYTHGAYIREIKDFYKECNIIENKWISLKEKKESLILSEFFSSQISSELKFCQLIYDMKKTKTGWQLRCDCHQELPWKICYKNGEQNLISQDLLKSSFSDPAQWSLFFHFYCKRACEENNTNGLMEIFNKTKDIIASYRTAEDLICLNDYFDQFDEISFTTSQITEFFEKIPELNCAQNINIHQAIKGYLFFPREFIEGYISPLILFSKLDIHYKLAISANYHYPLAYIYFSKLLKHSEIFENKIELYKNKALKYIEELTPCYLKTMWLFHTDMSDQELCIQKDILKHSHPFLQYTQANILERNDDIENALNIYQEIAEVYPPACFQLAYYQNSEKEQYHYFYKAAQKGILEGYVQIANLITTGYVVGEEVNHPQTAKEWFKKAADQNYIKALLSLADLYENTQQWDEAKKVYDHISSQGFLIGYLKKGQILENECLYQEAKEIYIKAMWFGLHKLFEMKVCAEDENTLIQIQNNKFNHFDSLIKIIEGTTENDEND